MTKNLLIVLLAVVGLSSCTNKSAFNFRESIVAIEYKIGEAVQRTQPQVERMIREQANDSLIAVCREVEQVVDKCIVELNNLETPNVPEAKEFKAAAVRYFGHFGQLYASYRNMGEQSTEADMMAAADKAVKLEEQTENVVESMRLAQQKYAKANGFKIK